VLYGVFATLHRVTHFGEFTDIFTRLLHNKNNLTYMTIVKQRLGKQIPAKSTRATEERQLLGNGQINTPT
jgi:hypothetical protein